MISGSSSEGCLRVSVLNSFLMFLCPVLLYALARNLLWFIEGPVFAQIVAVFFSRILSLKMND